MLVVFFAAGCKNNSSSGPAEADQSISSSVAPISYSIVRTFPHDTTLFREGLVFYDGKLFESSGAPGEYPYTRSAVGTDDLQTGKFDRKLSIDRKIYFGEGISFLNGI